ncbi:MAG: outer membrane lipoprotein chaperone LolA [Gammaproteobacteria bacterium]
MISFFRRLTILTLFICIAPTIAAKETPVSQLRAFLAASHTLSADFKQVAINEYGMPGQTSFGVFYLSRPGRFRWDYLDPFKQEIVAEGGKVWFYDEDLEQVTIKTLDQSLGSTPALLLSGEIDLEDNFALEHQGEEDGLTWLKLLPKDEDSGFKYILLGLVNGRLQGMELNDNFGQLTRIYFSNVKINPTLDEGLFKFVPPEGVDVFQE